MLSESSRIRSLDPHIAFDVVSGAVIEMLFDGLYTYDHEMRPIPSVAAALPVVAEDGKTFTIALREGVRFQNGRELTSEDVIWSFERMLHPDLHSPGSVYYAAIQGYAEYRDGKVKHVSGLRAVDRYTVEIKLTKPDQSFVHVLSMRFAVPVPREEVEKYGQDFGHHPMGTGPFKVASWDPGVRIVLERNPNYYRQGLPYLDRVVFEEGIASETSFMRFRNGEEDIITRPSSANRAELMKSPRWKKYLEMAASVDIYGLVMNCELAPFDNLHVRRAVSFAIDRERWARSRGDSLKPTGQMVPPQLQGYDPKLPSLQHFDLDKAREEMRLAGFPDGYPKPITFWISDSPAALIYGQLAQSDLAKIGLQITLKPVAFPVFIEATGTPKTAQLLQSGWVMDYPDPSNFLGLVHSNMRAPTNSENRAFYSNPVLDDLLDRGLVEQDPVKRVELYRQANDLVAAEAPWAFFGNTQSLQAWQPYVKGYRPHPSYWLPVNEVWLDLPRKRSALLATILGPLEQSLASLVSPGGAR